jgi:adenosylcobinamide-GDP ribazoletransferase
MPRGLVTALRTLTILPVPGRDAPDPAQALPWFPLAGCLLGLLLWGTGLAFDFVSGGWHAGAAVALTAGSAVLTRGLHLDGLADWADGSSGSRDRERALAIMKDPHVGAFGVMAVALALMARWAACTRLAEAGLLSWIVPACIVSRAAVAELSACLPYARAEGGTAVPFVNGAHPSHRVKALLLAVLLVSASSGLAGAAFLLCGWAACRLLGAWFRKRAGGVTGDLRGAGCEMVETGGLFFCAAWGDALARIAPAGFLPG